MGRLSTPLVAISSLCMGMALAPNVVITSPFAVANHPSALQCSPSTVYAKQNNPDLVIATFQQHSRNELKWIF